MDLAIPRSRRIEIVFSKTQSIVFLHIVTCSLFQRYMCMRKFLNDSVQASERYRVCENFSTNRQTNFPVVKLRASLRSTDLSVFSPRKQPFNLGHAIGVPFENYRTSCLHQISSKGFRESYSPHGGALQPRCGAVRFKFIFAVCGAVRWSGSKRFISSTVCIF